jgi:hypothetical protein
MKPAPKMGALATEVLRLRKALATLAAMHTMPAAYRRLAKQVLFGSSPPYTDRTNSDSKDSPP